MVVVVTRLLRIACRVTGREDRQNLPTSSPDARTRSEFINIPRRKFYLDRPCSGSWRIAKEGYPPEGKAVSHSALENSEDRPSNDTRSQRTITHCVTHRSSKLPRRRDIVKNRKALRENVRLPFENTLRNRSCHTTARLLINWGHPTENGGTIWSKVATLAVQNFAPLFEFHALLSIALCSEECIIVIHVENVENYEHNKITNKILICSTREKLMFKYSMY